MKNIARLLIIAGIAFFSIGIYLIWQRNDSSRLAFDTYEYSKSEAQLIETNNLPVKMTIPDLDLNLQVIPAKINGKQWDTTKEGVSYLTSSPIPGDEGNSVIYAHNWAGLFATLPQIKAGNVVEVEYADKTKKRFSIAYTLEVSPGDQSILKPSTDKRLTIYTCTGFLDSKRFVAVALLNDK